MTATAGPGPRPLTGVRVLDFSTFLAGPFCTQILSDLGAEVIKVESPLGDSSRSIPPHEVRGESLYYLSVNRNKKSVVIDLKSAAGRALALSLIAKVDVVVENFGPGVAEGLGLRAGELCEAHPRLVWSSISGFGREGRRSDLAAYDLIVQALSGVLSITGEPDRPPVRLGVPAGDLVAGLYSAIGIVAGLVDRGRSRGLFVDVAMFDGLLSMVSYLGAYCLFTDRAPGPQGSGHESIPTYRTFVAGDGRRLALTANTDRMWRDLCAVLECEHLTADPRFSTPAQRLANKDALIPLLEREFGRRPAAAWVQACNARDVPAALIRDVREALSDARDDTRAMVTQLHGPLGEHVAVVGNPIKLDGAGADEFTYPPRLGEHTREVLTELLGRTAHEIDDLVAQGAVRVDPRMQRTT